MLHYTHGPFLMMEAFGGVVRFSQKAKRCFSTGHLLDAAGITSSCQISLMNFLGGVGVSRYNTRAFSELSLLDFHPLLKEDT